MATVSDDYSWRRVCSSATNCVEVGWRRATASLENGNCVEVGWHSRCGESGQCVEVAAAMVQVAVRDSKDPDGPVLRFPRGAWREFVEGVKAGDYDSPLAPQR
jgi:hypothetical protein